MIWKDVKGYEGLYKVSNTGEVKTLERKVIRVNGRPLNHKERILSQTINRYGYISNRMKRKCKPRNGIEYKRIK